METSKEKAKKLVDKFQYMTVKNNPVYLTKTFCKQCALICVDEMIKQNGELYLNNINKEHYIKKNGELFEVKQEIEKC